MTLKYLLDTNILSEPTKKQPDPHVIKKLLEHHDQIATAAQVLYELTVGLGRMPNSARKSKVRYFLENFVHATIPILTYDEAAANCHAKQVILQEKGITLPFIDTQIASIADANRLILVTRNTNDFKYLQGIKLENWFSS